MADNVQIVLNAFEALLNQRDLEYSDVARLQIGT